MEYFEIGEIVNTHGIKGYVAVKPLTDFPDRFTKMESAVIEKYNGTFDSYKIDDVIFHKNRILIKFDNINDMNQAQELRGRKIVVERKDLMKLPEDSYYVFDLIDCDVYEDNEYLGKVKDVIETGSNDVYIVRKDEAEGGISEILIPVLAWVVLDIDIPNKKIQVKLPEGLKDI